jgi:hypothetical protein
VNYTLSRIQRQHWDIINASIFSSERKLSRVINTQGVGKERNRLLKAIVISLRELTKQTKPDSTTKDLAAFIALALEAISETVDRTVSPWEKRDYWVKADKFRRDWAWAGKLGKDMRSATINQEWSQVAILSAQVAGHLGNIVVSEKHRMGKPWEGAWQQLMLKENEKNNG